IRANAAAAMVPYMAWRYLPARQSFTRALNTFPSSINRFSGPLELNLLLISSEFSATVSMSLGVTFSAPSLTNSSSGFLNTMSYSFPQKQKTKLCCQPIQINSLSETIFMMEQIGDAMSEANEDVRHFYSTLVTLKLRIGISPVSTLVLPI